MTQAYARPKLAVIVANAITGDSRVQKTALAAAHAGWDVTLIGRAPEERIEHSWLGPVRVIRVPVMRAMRQRETRRRRMSLRSSITQAGLRTTGQLALYQAAHASRSHRRGEAIGRLMSKDAPLGDAPVFALKAWRKLTEEWHGLRLRAYNWEERRLDLDQPVGDWRRDWPALLDLELAFGPVLMDLKPDVIHANDITMLNTAATTAGRLRAAGHKVAWLYDAHEYVAGVDWPYPRMMSAYPAAERELIHRADAVVTVSPEIAELIRDENNLGETPLVVRNTPVRQAAGSSSVSVRETVGVGGDVPLMVYSGYIHHERSIGTAVESLPDLPEFHLAIVSGQRNAELETILARARQLGVRDRVHVAPYVAQHEVVDYLRSADIGVICSKRTINYELSLPTKMAEYLHAGLPVVVSDLKTLSAFVRTHGVGEVFDPEVPDSFGRAVRALWESRATTVRHIDEAVLEELSWEHQARGLLDLYSRLSGLAPRPRAEDVGWSVHERPGGPASATGETTSWRPLSRTTVRLGLGPANYAGQLSALAQVVTSARADVSAEVFVRNTGSPFRYPADVQIPARRLNRLDGQVEQLRRILPHYTHLIADAFQPVFGTLNGHDIGGDLPALAARRIKVALLSHGSDTRHPERHKERVAWSLYHDSPRDEEAGRLHKVERNHQIARESGLPVFVTTPDLLDDLPGATWLPLIVDVDAWACDRPVMERHRPIVLHAPSKRWTKGTDRFAPALEAMAARGLIEFQMAEGLPWAQMRERVMAADIVVDQVAIGSYGAFACEAMAAGKPVIAYLSDDVLAAAPDNPIVNATPDQVAAVVESLVKDADEANRIGRASAAYARRQHDGAAALRALEEFLRPRA